MNRIKSKYAPILLGLLSGFSIFYFLYFLDAFGIHKGISYSGHSHLFRSISFGVITAVALAFMEGIVKPKIVRRNIAFKLIWVLSLMFIGSQIVFLLFNFFWNWQELSAVAYTLILKEFPLMMMIPFAFYWLIVYRWKSQAEDVFLEFKSENGKDRLKIKYEDFLFAQSSENYVNIHYLSAEESKTHLIRKPLKKVEEELKMIPGVQRCHRQYLINQKQIKSIKEKKGKYSLEIDSHTIPISNTYKEIFLKQEIRPL